MPKENKIIPNKKSRAFKISLLVLSIALIGFGCASKKIKVETEQEKYTVAVFNNGALTSLYRKASLDIGSFNFINLAREKQIFETLDSQGASVRKLIEAKTFDDVSGIKGFDFALILMPAPAAYAAGHVGFKSINWRKKTIVSMPGVEVPRRPGDWLVATRNGWINIHSNPSSALIEIDGRVAGYAPLFFMYEKNEVTIAAHWDSKYESTKTFDLSKETNLSIDAPADYIAKMNKRGAYKRLQDFDERHGERIFIVFYVIIIVGSVVIALYSPY